MHAGFNLILIVRRVANGRGFPLIETISFFFDVEPEAGILHRTIAPPCDN